MHYLSRLHALGDAESSRSGGGQSTIGVSGAAFSLARMLFHHNHPEEPIRPTANRSLPGAHLSASLTAHIAGVAAAGLEGAAAHTALRNARCSETGLSLPALARETGVSIARFERLVEAVRHADTAVLGVPHVGSALLVSHLWLRSSNVGKRALTVYLETLNAAYGPVFLPCDGGGGGSGDEEVKLGAELEPAAVRDAAAVLFSGKRGARSDTDAGPDAGPGSGSGAGSDARAGSDAGASTAASACEAAEAAIAFETIAAAWALASDRSTPLLQGRYSFRGQPAVPDCAELVARELLNALLWCPVRREFDVSRLPPTADARLVRFYAPGGMAHSERDALRELPDAMPARHATRRIELGGVPLFEWHDAPARFSPASAEWFNLVSGLEGVAYLTGRSDARYELAPTVDSVVACLGALLGVRLSSPCELQELWRRRQPARALQLQFSPSGDRLLVLEPFAGGDNGGDDGSRRREAARVLMRTEGAHAGAEGVQGGAEGVQGGAEGRLRVSLELVMSGKLNHAFAIHNWAAVPWQRNVAEAALARLVDDAIAKSSHHHRPPSGLGPSWPPDPMPALLPAVLQPLLTHLDHVSAAEVLTTEQLRLMLLSTDPRDHVAIGVSLLQFLAARAVGREPLASTAATTATTTTATDTTAAATDTTPTAIVATAIVATTPTANPTATDDDNWPLNIADFLPAPVLRLVQHIMINQHGVACHFRPAGWPHGHVDVDIQYGRCSSSQTRGP